MDLSHIPVVDAHCHLIYPAYHDHDLARTLSLSLENPPADQVGAGLLYHKILGELAHLWWGGTDQADRTPDTPGEDMVVAARREKMQADYEGYVGRLFADANLRGMVVDLGYKPAAAPLPEFERVVPAKAVYLFRIESVVDELWKTRLPFDEAEGRFRAAINAAVPGGHVGFKTIIGYRTGLDIRPVGRDEAARAWEENDEKTVRDYFVLVTLDRCRVLGCPLQIHTAFGESNIDLRRNNPLHLKAVLELETARPVPIVLVHGGYPHSFEAGYLAAMYPNVYVDLSEGIPWAALEAENILRKVLSLAPLNKVMFGSDGFIIPEIAWIAARMTREALGSLLESMVRDMFVTATYADTIAENVLGRTAARVFGLDV